jgi:predicted RNA-binding protein YlxR (DUF448 family)
VSNIQKVKKKPIRTCVACRQAADKRTLLRFVRNSDGTADLDFGGRAPGRGAYLHADTMCFSSAKKTKALARALRIQFSADDYDKLEAQFASFVMPMAAAVDVIEER